MINEPFVNQVLMNRVLEIKQRSQSNRLILDTIDTTKMWNLAMNMPDEELIVCTLAALHKCPDMVFTAIATDRAELVMNNKIREILEKRKTILMDHIELDKKCLNDSFLCQFMEGRVESEMAWLEEITRILTSILESDGIKNVLENRRAILRTFIADAQSHFKDTDGQKMRGKTAVNTHWLEETEEIIGLLDK